MNLTPAYLLRGTKPNPCIWPGKCQPITLQIAEIAVYLNVQPLLFCRHSLGYYSNRLIALLIFRLKSCFFYHKYTTLVFICQVLFVKSLHKNLINLKINKLRI